MSRESSYERNGKLLEPVEAGDQRDICERMPPHLDRYIDEQSFRFNERDKDDGNRFRIVLKSVTGKRLTYSELTGHDTAEAT